eukprot:Gregarina_sp_Pseudo_9__5729@NODE_833_length_2150_cov_176_531975_g781_i0_p4_GENE_NODE_833_length_2150_cov_176_531975_g781_i0NODE_833_length_2150_cov_176_531975_g781_i0_p4_ORF_typecomplete_len113_score0_83UPF0300/PF08594_10/0_078_NODE_833_length_2150_cov_176_531975_g781_i012521590
MAYRALWAKRPYTSTTPLFLVCWCPFYFLRCTHVCVCLRMLLRSSPVSGKCRWTTSEAAHSSPCVCAWLIMMISCPPNSSLLPLMCLLAFTATLALNALSAHKYPSVLLLPP